MSDTQRRLVWLATLLGLATAFLTAQPSRPEVDDSTVTHLLPRLERHAEQFRRSLAETRDREWLVGGEQTQHIDHFVSGFVDAARRLRTQFGEGRIVTARVEEVLRRGVSIDSFMERHRSADRASQDWAAVRRDLEALAGAFGIPWNRTPPRLTRGQPARPAREGAGRREARGPDSDGAACERA